MRCSRLTRRYVSFFLLLSLLVAGCTAPGDAQQGTITPIAQTESISLTFAIHQDEQATYTPLARQFEQHYPHIRIHFLDIDTTLNQPAQRPDEQERTALARIVSKADIFPAALVGVHEQQSPALLNLTSLMDADAAFEQADFFPSALNQAMRGDRMWMLPTSFRLPLLAYNADAFTRAGLPLPSAPWTWRTMLDTLEQFTSRDGAFYGFLDPSGGVFSLSMILQANGSALGVDDFARLEVDRPTMVTAFDQLQQLIRQHAILIPGLTLPDGQPAVDGQEAINNGQVAFWPDDAVSLTRAQQEAPSLHRLVIPQGENPLAGQALYGYAISAGTQHPQEAWQWISFLTRQNLVGLSSVAPDHLPARRSVLEASHLLQQLPPAMATDYQAAVAQLGATTVPRTDVDPRALEFLQQMIVTVLGQGGKHVAQVLPSVQSALAQQQAALDHGASATPVRPAAVATPELPTNGGTATITFLAPGTMVPDLAALQSRFHTHYPDIEITLMSTNELTSTPSIQSVAQASDCFVWRGQPETPADRAAIRDLQPLFDADATLSAASYPAAVLAAARESDRLWGLPYGFQADVLSYNQALFDAAQLAPPSVGWTPDDFLTAAAELSHTVNGKETYGYVPLIDPGMDLFFFTQQLGAKLVTGSGPQAQPHFDDPAVVSAIQWYIDLFQVHHVMPKPVFVYKQNTYFGTEGQDLIRQGHAGMWFSWGTPQPDAEAAIGSAPLPIGKHGLFPTSLHIQSLFLSAHTQQSDACWVWMRFLASNPPGGGGTLIPAQLDIADQAVWASQAMTETVALYHAYRPALLERRTAEESDGGTALDWYWFYDAVTQAVEHDADLTTVLARAQQQTEQFMACARTGTEASACALQVDPEYEGYHLPLSPAPGAG